MSDERVNIFQNLDRDSFKLIRQGIIDLVLATDMSKHFVHLNKFVSVFTNSIVSVCRYFTNYLNLFKLVLFKIVWNWSKLEQICQGIINLVLATLLTWHVQSFSYTSTNSSASSPTQLFWYAVIFELGIQTCLKLFRYTITFKFVRTGFSCFYMVL